MKKFLIVSLIVLCIAAAAAYLAVYGRNQKQTITQDVNLVSVDGVGTSEGKNPVSGVGTLKELQAKGKDFECQVVFEQTGTTGNIEGTLFIAKGNLRGDFMVPAPEFGGKVLSSMIVGGTSMYVWTKIENDTFGFKSDLSNEKTKQINTKEPVPLEASVQYTCTDWTEVDGSVFVPPAGVQFKDLTAVIDAGMEYGTKPIN
jgi:hypothetical protein